MSARNLALDVLARGYRCPRCKATPDEPCRTRRTNEATDPHIERIDRAVALYSEARA